VAVGVPKVKVADPAFNAAQTIELARHADAEGAALTLFPELGISAYPTTICFNRTRFWVAVVDRLKRLSRPRVT
jgi:NAD+ synthase (glutamine-hydrolysing)